MCAAQSTFFADGARFRDLDYGPRDFTCSIVAFAERREAARRPLVGSVVVTGIEVFVLILVFVG